MAGMKLMGDRCALRRFVPGMSVLLSLAAVCPAVRAQEELSPVPVPGTRVVYSPFSEDGPLFHYVSANPSYQLGVGPGLQAGADHIAAQQCLDGGWGWPHDSCSTTYNNITGPIALGLLEVYGQTSSCFLLDSAVAGGDFDLTFQYGNGEPRFGAFAPYFLWNLTQVTGNSAYADHAAVWFFDELSAGTYGTSDLNTAGWIAAVQAARTGTWVNLRPWEFHNLIPTAAAIGNASQATAFTDACRDGLDTLDNTSPGSVYSDIIGIAGGVRGLAFAGATSFTAINSPLHSGIDTISTLQGLADYLAGLQNADGSWNWHSNLAPLGGATEGDKDTQTTAYAILALLEADPHVGSDYSTNVAKARDWLRSMQLVDGGFMSYPGGDENTEVEGEALTALAPDTCSTNVLEFLLASGSDCVKPGDPITVELHQRDLAQLVRGFQAFAQFDSSMMTHVSNTFTSTPYGLTILNTVAGDEVDMAAGINDLGGQLPTSSDALLVTLQFTAGATEGPTTLSFRTHTPPSRFSDTSGGEVLPCLVASPTIVIDGTAPVLSLPLDATIECDASTDPSGVAGYATATDNLDCSPVVTYSDAITAGACPDAYTITRTWVATDCAGNASSADQIITVEDTTLPMITCPPDVTIECDESTDPLDTGLYLWMPFDTSPTLSATQAPGVWYTDRYAPAGFASAFFDGDNRLMHSIDAADGATSRPGAYSSSFYNTQGRKYDLALGTTRMTIDLYVPSSWASTGERMAGFWGTAFDAGAVLSSYPIIEFTSTDGTPRFRGWATDPGAWVDMGTPTGFVYDAWYTLEIELVGSNWVYTVGDLQLTIDALGSVEIGNVILQGHNTTAGVTYDIYWDNFTATHTATAVDNCDPAPVITYSDVEDYSACGGYTGTITRTWTAEDACGNSDSCVQTITVVDVTAPLMNCPADVTVSCEESTAPSNTGTPNFFQGFEDDTFGWFDLGGTLTRVPSGTGGVTSADGSWHAETDGAFTRWGGYSSVFPAGGYRTSVDVYLDTSLGLANDTRMDFSSAINNTAGSHRRDFAISIGFYNSADVTGPGAGTDRFIMSFSNNTPGWPKNPARDPFAVGVTGWYTLEHHFYDSGGGILACDLNLYDAGGTLLHSWTLSDPTDIIGSTVGGNRYGWFLNMGWALPIDNTFINTGLSVAFDNCDPAPVVSYSDVVTPGGCPQEWTITRTWMAIDACGNSTSCDQIITVVDDTAPTFTFTPPDVTLECDEDVTPGIPYATVTGGVAIYYNDNGGGEVPANQAFWKAQFDATNDPLGGANGAALLFDNAPLVGGSPFSWHLLYSGLPYPQSQFGLDFVLQQPTWDGSVPTPVLNAYDNVNGSLAGRALVGPVTWAINDYTGAGVGPSNPASDVINSIVRSASPGNPLVDIEILQLELSSVGPVFTVDMAGRLISDGVHHWYTPSTPHSPMSNFGLNGDIYFAGSLSYDSTGDPGTDLIDYYAGTITLTANAPNATGIPLAVDNCDPLPVLTYSDDLSGLTGCNGTGTIVRTWTATDACGNFATFAQNIFIVDTTPPVITCPPDISVVADAGECTALVSPGSPTASDNCDPSPVITFSRSDGALNLSDPYDSAFSPITITWTATDACGNMASCDQTITVAAVNEVVVDIALSPAVESPLTRCITFELYECGGPSAFVVEQELTFTLGVASAVLEVPCGVYECITARDKLHTLSRTIDPLPISGTQYVADFILAGKDLIGGNLNDDLFIDILDFGTFSMQFGTNYGTGDTTCATAAPHSDISGNGIVGTEDFTFIANNFLDMSDANCCSMPRDPGLGTEPITEISLAELRRMGLGHLSAGDLNGDGWLDQQDVVAFLNGARPGIAPAPRQPDPIRPKRR